jgi:hypothetical protein
MVTHEPEPEKEFRKRLTLRSVPFSKPCPSVSKKAPLEETSRVFHSKDWISPLLGTISTCAGTCRLYLVTTLLSISSPVSQRQLLTATNSKKQN